MILDALHDLLDLALRQTRVPERLAPNRMLQPRAQLYGELGSRGDAKNDARAAVIDVTVMETSGVGQDPLCRDKREELDAVRRGNRLWRKPELHWIERHRIEVSPSLGIRHVRNRRVRIVVVLDQPMAGRNVCDPVGGGNDVAPEADYVMAPRKQGTHSDDGYGRISRHL